MILSVQQPIFLPWPGFFFKAAHSDILVLLDDVQFPRGRSWMARNRLKNDQGEFWLTIPVRARHGTKQTIRDVRIAEGSSWRERHIRGVRQQYANAPYLEEYFPSLESIYGAEWTKLADFNIEIIRCMAHQFGITARIVRQSSLQIAGQGQTLLIDICKSVGARRYLALQSAEKYLDRAAFEKARIEVVRARFSPPIYPQLRGEFRYNLSALDLLLNCGPKSASILQRS